MKASVMILGVMFLVSCGKTESGVIRVPSNDHENIQVILENIQNSLDELASDVNTLQDDHADIQDQLNEVLENQADILDILVSNDVCIVKLKNKDKVFKSKHCKKKEV